MKGHTGTSVTAVNSGCALGTAMTGMGWQGGHSQITKGQRVEVLGSSFTWEADRYLITKLNFIVLCFKVVLSWIRMELIVQH